MKSFKSPTEDLTLKLHWSDRECQYRTDSSMLVFLQKVAANDKYNKDNSPKVKKALQWLHREIETVQQIPAGESRLLYFCTEYQANACRSLPTESLSWLNRRVLVEREEFQKELYNKFGWEMVQLFSPLIQRVRELGKLNTKYHISIREYSADRKFRDLFVDLRPWFARMDTDLGSKVPISIVDPEQWEWGIILGTLEPAFKTVLLRGIVLRRSVQVYAYNSIPTCLHVRATVNDWWTRWVADVRPLEDSLNEPTGWY